MARARRNPLTPQDAVDLAPLQNSHEADALESELKALFKLSYDTNIKPAERATNTVGTPHLGPFDQVERAVKAEGLALQRRGGEDAMRYLFRSWRARNPKRGLHMLRAYLQVLWPNGWLMWQMWQDKARPYPALTVADEGDHFLTSRVHVQISSGVSDGSDVLAASQALRSVLPARFLLYTALRQDIDLNMAAACGFYKGILMQTFEGDFGRADAHIYMAPYMTGVVAERFTGTIS